jgi:hypothetical protein
MHEQHEIGMPVAKAASAWALIGVTSWTEVAAFLGAVYSAILICEWALKRFRPGWAVRRGWVK